MKLVSFAIGLGLLIVGAITLNFPDWDVGVSVAMATATLLSTEWSIVVIWHRLLPMLERNRDYR